MLTAVIRQVFKKLPDLRLAGTWACVLSVLAFPAAAQEPACAAPEKPMLDIDLMFGRNIHDVLGVTEENWDDFMVKEIATRFPQGFTVLDAVGHWQGGQELSKRVLISVDARCEEAVQTKIDVIVKAYRERFDQESVGVVIDRACVSFCRPRSSCKPEREPPNCWPDHATKEKAQAMATKAADMLKKEGPDKALAAFNTDSDWRDGDLYVFVIDDKGTWRASGARPELVSKNEMDKPFIKEIVAIDDADWVDYKFISPADNQEHDKSSYIVRVDGLFVGVGAYQY